MWQTIIIVGNLGRDPEMRFTQNDKAYTRFSIASSRRYTNNEGESIDETTWFNITVWGKQAESCNQYLRKGSRVLVEGRLVPDSSTGGPRIWTRQDGTPGASFDVTAQVVRFLTSRAEMDAGSPSGEYSPEARPSATDEEEIPF
jgi:single-strand DNA-binding protein